VADDRTALRATFDRAAGTYGAARPAYPDELFHDLVDIADLRQGARLLEVGCGTGIATRPLAERAFSIVCVELGSHLAGVARRNLAGLPVEVHTSSFEAWEGRPSSFDLVYAATAWHWIDPEIGYAKARRLLRPGGHLALWRAGHAFPPDYDPFFAEIQAVYDAIGEGHPGEWPPDRPEDVPDDTGEIEASGLFNVIEVRRYVWALAYTRDEYIALLDTFSDHINMAPAKRERLYSWIRQRAGEPVTRHWQAILHVARPTEWALRSPPRPEPRGRPLRGWDPV
jgi:SAM-dependent methyltransferase